MGFYCQDVPRYAQTQYSPQGPPCKSRFQSFATPSPASLNYICSMQLLNKKITDNDPILPGLMLNYQTRVGL